MALRSLILSGLLLSSFWSCVVHAQSSALYTGEVAMDPALPSDTVALRALDQVLTRLTGVTDRSLVEELGLDASVLRLLVSSQQRISRPMVGPEDTQLPEQVRLRIDFDQPGIDRLLARHALPRLGRERPAILLWLALEDAEGPRLQGGRFLEQEVLEQARRLGLDVVRPLADLIDLADIDVSDIRGGFLDSAEASARRYGAQVIALLDLRRSDQAWSARWFWRLDGRDAGVQATHEEISMAIAVGLERILGALVERFGVAADAEPGGHRRVVVRGIDQEVQYAEVLRHLESLSTVANVQVLAARGSEIEFELRLRSAGLEDSLALGGVLGIEDREADGSLLLRLMR